MYLCDVSPEPAAPPINVTAHHPEPIETFEGSESDPEPDSEDEDEFGEAWMAQHLEPSIPLEQRLDSVLGTQGSYDLTSEVCTRYMEFHETRGSAAAKVHFQRISKFYSSLCTDSANRQTTRVWAQAARLRRIVHNLSLLEEHALGDPIVFTRLFRGKSLPFQIDWLRANFGSKLADTFVPDPTNWQSL